MMEYIIFLTLINTIFFILLCLVYIELIKIKTTDRSALFKEYNADFNAEVKSDLYKYIKSRMDAERNRDIVKADADVNGWRFTRGRY